MGDMLSQAEIDALLGGGSSSPEPDIDSNTEEGLSEPLDAAAEVDGALTSEQKDILGEIGNISMGTAATTLFALLNQKVWITTPKVKIMTWKTLSAGYSRPCVGVRVDYIEGLRGSNILILKQRDVKIISNLMMGGDGSVGDEVVLDELDLSAMGEAMNQMIGSSSTSLSSMIKNKIDIDTPKPFLLDFSQDADMLKNIGFDDETVLACISFRMEIGDLIDSEIMQILPAEFAMNMVETLKSDMSGDSEPAPTPAPAAPAASAAPQPAPQPQPVPMPQPVPQPMPQQPYPQYNEQQQAPPPYYPPPQQPAGAYAPPPPNYGMYQQPFVQPNVDVQPAQFQSFDVAAVMQQKENIDIIMDVPLEVTVELGRSKKKIKDILEFSPGTIIELDKLAGEPIDILVNGKFVAKGEVVVIDENFGIRVTDIISVENRI